MILLGTCALVAFAGEYLPAVVLGAVGTATIALRGYLIPYTPRLAPVLGRFFGWSSGRDPTGKRDHGTLADGGASEDVDEEEILSTLVESGALRVGEERVRLTAEVDDRWHEEMGRLRELDTGPLLDEVREVTPAAKAAATEHAGKTWIVLSDEDESIEEETWLSRPGAIAEAAAVYALDGTVDDPIRLFAARSMRPFLARCPDCRTPLEETTAASCCGGFPGVRSAPDTVFACPECDVWLYRVESTPS